MALYKICCIEDDPESASLITEALAELGYEVDRKGDGSSGLKAILDEEPDLVLCDVRMPRMSGFDVLERMSAAGAPYSDIPFIFLTALADRDNELAARRLGADDYLTKPIDFEMLGAVVANRLRRREGPAAPEVATGSLTWRETEVLTWVGRGKTSSEIGTILGLSERTVNFHCEQAMRRLDVINRTQAVAKAMTEGLISP